MQIQIFHVHDDDWSMTRFKLTKYWKVPSLLDAVRPPSSARILEMLGPWAYNFQEMGSINPNSFQRKKSKRSLLRFVHFGLIQWANPGIFRQTYPCATWQLDCSMVAIQWMEGFFYDGCDDNHVVLVPCWRLWLFFYVIHGSLVANAEATFVTFLSSLWFGLGWESVNDLNQ